MESIRIFLRRSTAVPDDVEGQHQQQPAPPMPSVSTANMSSNANMNTTTAAPEMEQRSSPGSRFLPRFSSFMGSRRSSVTQPQPQQQHQQHPPRPSSSHYSESVVESPKTPHFALGMPPLPSTRLHLPNLARTWSHGSNGPPSRPNTGRAPQPQPQQTGNDDSRSPSRIEGPLFPEVARPDSVHTPRGVSGLDEERLAALMEEGRERRRRRRQRHREGASDEDDEERRRRRYERHRRRRREQRDRESNGPTPKRYLCCFPWVKSRRVRSQILQCFVSGTFLVLLLGVYLALSITRNITTNEFTVLLILIILFTTIFFCHALIRLCMYMIKSPRRRQEEEEEEARIAAEEAESRRMTQHGLQHMYAPGGYAVPREPIRVVLARDEEAAGIESETLKFQPPAYGLWRESVRVDPNRIYWQRNDHPALADEQGDRARDEGEAVGGSSGPGLRRPPSYASDDGVSYVVEARPRSMAPTVDVPLGPHPSESGRDVPPLPRWQ